MRPMCMFLSRYDQRHAHSQPALCSDVCRHSMPRSKGTRTGQKQKAARARALAKAENKENFHASVLEAAEQRFVKEQQEAEVATVTAHAVRLCVDALINRVVEQHEAAQRNISACSKRREKSLWP